MGFSKTAACGIPRGLMKITRYLDSKGATHFAADGKRIDGDLFGKFTVTGEKADLRKTLAPVAPASILCIGLDYRHHAEIGRAHV